MSISFNPYAITNAAGSFSVQSDGYVQGTAMPDPTVRNLLSGGTYNPSAGTVPIWGGQAISEETNGTSINTGGVVVQATTNANITGFSVFDQAYNWVITPGNGAPVGSAGQTVPFYRIGSNARIAVQCDPALTALGGGLVNQQVSWDLTSQMLVTYAPLTAANAITVMSWASTAGGTVTVTTTGAHGLSVGNHFTISGAVPAAYNGDWVAITGTTGSTIKFLLPAASTPGTVTTLGQVDAFGGALNVRVLDINTNSKIVSFNSTTNIATWTTGACALILI